MAKIPTAWSQNPDAEANRKTYDSATTTYNSATVTYDSIVVGNEAETEKETTEWSND